MPITLQYGANPTVAMMAAYQGGKNAYRNKQEEEYRRLYMQQQQLQQQAQLQREHMQYQFLATQGQMGFQADQQEKAIEARQGIMNQRLEVGEVENKNTWAMRKFGIDAANAMRLRIVREQIKARKKEGPPDDPGPEGLPSQELDDIPEVDQPERTGFPKPRLAAYGLGGRPPTTAQQRGQEQSRARQQSLVESRRAYQIGLQGQSGSVNQTRYDPYLRRMVPVDEYRNYYGG